MAGMIYAGKAVLVTGGATGIGRAACVAFAAEGAKVMIGDVDALGAAVGDDEAAGSSAMVTVPENSVNSPLTLDRPKCFTPKPTWLWPASML